MKRLVVKIGSSSLVKGGGLDLINMRRLVEQTCILRNEGVEVVIVTSGAIAAGINKLGLVRKPQDVAKKQALAAIGQPSLIKAYEQLFEEYSVLSAQILLSHDDFGSRKRTAHLTDAFKALFAYGVVPIVNENDALTVDEIKVGDNDTLSALVALIVGADALVLLTDVDGLYDGDPARDENAKLIRIVENVSDVAAFAADASSAVGTGGMRTKLSAATIATEAGIETRIINVKALSELSEIAKGSCSGTLFKAKKKSRTAKQSWLLHCATKCGTVIVDDGAKSALKNRKSLLSCGVLGVKGDFRNGDALSVCDKNGDEFAVGLAIFSARETEDIIGKSENRVIVHADSIGII